MGYVRSKTLIRRPRPLYWNLLVMILVLRKTKFKSASEIVITFFAHPHGQAFLESAALATVSSALVNQAFLVANTDIIRILLDRSLVKMKSILYH